jgi:hypothetical protein
VISLVAVNAMQVMSALLIFVIGYLALLLSIVVCFGLASFVYEGATFARACTVKSALRENGAMAEIGVKGGMPRRLRWGFLGLATGLQRMQRAPIPAVAADAIQHRPGGTPRYKMGTP